METWLQISSSHSMKAERGSTCLYHRQHGVGGDKWILGVHWLPGWPRQQDERPGHQSACLKARKQAASSAGPYILTHRRTPPPNSRTHTYACTNSLMVMITFLIPSLIFIHRLEEEKNRFVSFVCSLSIIWNLLLPSPPTFPPQPVRSQYECCVRFSMFILVNPLCDLLSWLMSEAGVILHREHPMGWDGVPARVSGGFCHSLLLLPGNSKFDCDTTCLRRELPCTKKAVGFGSSGPRSVWVNENAATPGYLRRRSTVLLRCCFRTVILSQWAYFNEQIPTPSQVT